LKELQVVSGALRKWDEGLGTFFFPKMVFFKGIEKGDFFWDGD
jgi:hypothetical protein